MLSRWTGFDGTPSNRNGVPASKMADISKSKGKSKAGLKPIFFVEVFFCFFFFGKLIFPLIAHDDSHSQRHPTSKQPQIERTNCNCSLKCKWICYDVNISTITDEWLNSSNNYLWCNFDVRVNNMNSEGGNGISINYEKFINVVCLKRIGDRCIEGHWLEPIVCIMRRDTWFSLVEEGSWGRTNDVTTKFCPSIIRDLSNDNRLVALKPNCSIFIQWMHSN